MGPEMSDSSSLNIENLVLVWLADNKGLRIFTRIDILPVLGGVSDMRCKSVTLCCLPFRGKRSGECFVLRQGTWFIQHVFRLRVSVSTWN